MAPTSTSLTDLSALLRDGENVISPYVRDTHEVPALGALAASGPRAAEAPGEYTVLVEAIREGYLLHYEEPRLIEGADGDLRLLAGDYLYALGLEKLAARGDLDAVRELADLISLSAQLHARGEARDVPALWLAAALAVAAGADDARAEAKDALRGGDRSGAAALMAAARAQAESEGLGGALAEAADSIGFAPHEISDRG
ncbi:MAG: hypothetical protein ACXW0S_10175 [Solirubrobacterales bacterium]